MKALGGARFSLVNLVPVVILVVFLTLLAISGLYAGDDPDLGKAVQKLGDNAGWAVVAVFAVFVLAVLLRPFQAALVQLLEGYWKRWPVLKHVEAFAIERHRRIRHTADVIREAYSDPGPAATDALALDDVAAAQRHKRRAEAIDRKACATFERYPTPSWEWEEDPPDEERNHDDFLMPTLLGNTLRNGEENSGRRYGLRLQAVAQHLYFNSSPKLNSAIDQILNLIDTTAAMCVSFAVAAVSSLPLIGRWDRWSFIPLAAAALSVLAYRGAIRIAESHARLLATAFDLHRFDMLAALHYELPITPDREREFNRKLSDFLDSKNAAVDHMGAFTYVHPAPAARGDHAEAGPAESGPNGGGSTEGRSTG